MKSLESIIEEEMVMAVERIVRASKAAAIAAFEQQFDQLGYRPQPPKAALKNGVSSGQKKRKPAKRKRRSEEIATLETRLLSVVRTNPGQPMATLAAQVGVKPKDLRVPVVRLKAKKQIKLVGQRHLTCYFPVENGAGAQMATT